MILRIEKTALIIFAREPELGKVKTRLQKDLPKDKILRLYKAFLRDVLSLAERIRCGTKNIYYTGTGSIKFLARFKNKFGYVKQSSGDLGERMHQAFCLSRKSGAERTVIIGTDCLEIVEEDIQDAFTRLSSHDVVLGPSCDGGYYLIGLKKPIKGLFINMPWGTPGVLEATLRRIKKMRKKVFLLNEKSDIDTFSDLMRICRVPNFKKVAPHSWKIIRDDKIC